MSGKPAIHHYANLRTLARKLRDDLGGVELILLYAYNRTGVAAPAKAAAA